MSNRPELRAGSLVAHGIRTLVVRPFLVLVVLALLLNTVTATVPSGAELSSLLTSLLLAALTVYVQIATVLAAASDTPERSADIWVRAGFKARCFWRFVGVEVFVFVMVALGLLVVVAGGFVAGAYLALAQPAVVLERLSLPKAVSRSVDMSEGNRVQLGIVYGVLILIPSALVPAAYILGLTDSPLTSLAATLAATVVSTAGSIALTKAFVLLGGAATHPSRRLDAPAAGSGRL